MTRSLGDFYLHACGVTWVPEVSSVDLKQVADSLRAPVLFLASDGFWDLWSYQEVRRAAAQPRRGPWVCVCVCVRVCSQSPP